MSRKTLCQTCDNFALRNRLRAIVHAMPQHKTATTTTTDKRATEFFAADENFPPNNIVHHHLNHFQKLLEHYVVLRMHLEDTRACGQLSPR